MDTSARGDDICCVAFCCLARMSCASVWPRLYEAVGLCLWKTRNGNVCSLPSSLTFALPTRDSVSDAAPRQKEEVAHARAAYYAYKTVLSCG